ncbi:TPA_asm: protein 3 [Asclepias syriaca virus 3]|uniref:Protein 3 n=1 Tax=Asclepias syriaca virus 3 TaxID=2977955 RepID=A0A9N6YJH6_9RHAB|nr:TPA_asm: protein 3 [Asclepias syriaca virus 3]
MSLHRNSSARAMDVTELPNALDIKLSDVSKLDYIDDVVKKTFESNMRVTLKNSHATFRFEGLSSWSQYLNGLKGNKSLCEPEIHMVWKPFIPNQNRDWKLNVTLIWDGDNEPLQSVVFPLHLHAHIVLYPNHSAPICKGNKLPWHIDFKVEDADIPDTLPIADIWAQLKGNISKTSTYGGHEPAKIISLVPLGEHFSGIAISKPYQMRDPLRISGFQIRVGAARDRAKLLMLQEYGVDIQGLALCDQLKKTLQSISNEELKKQNDTEVREQVLKKIYRQVGMLDNK